MYHEGPWDRNPSQRTKIVDKMRHRFVLFAQKIIAGHPNLALVTERYHEGYEEKVFAFGQKFIVSSSM